LKHEKPPGNSSIHLASREALQARFFARQNSWQPARCCAIQSSALRPQASAQRMERRKGTTMKGFLVGLILGMLIVPIALFCYVESAASQGMFPHAPQLFTAKETVTDDPVGVTYWKVKNGIRLTGMPGFQKALSDQQMWQVAALMASADKLPPDVLRGLLPAPAPANVTAAAPVATPAQPPAPLTPLPTSPSQPK
jgi:hypothetical protein